LDRNFTFSKPSFKLNLNLFYSSFNYIIYYIIINVKLAIQTMTIDKKEKENNDHSSIKNNPKP